MVLLKPAEEGDGGGVLATSPQLTMAMGTHRGVSVCWGAEGPTGVVRTERQDVASPRMGSKLMWSHYSSCPVCPGHPQS